MLGRRTARRVDAREVHRYVPSAGLSIPVVTVLDRSGEILEDEQRAVVRWAVQEGHGANIIFAAGTTGEWNRLDNPRRQQIARVVVDECRRINAAGSRSKPGSASPDIRAPRRWRTSSMQWTSDAEAVVVAPLSIRDSDDPVGFVNREINALFERSRQSVPVFLYDNAEISAPGHPQHMHTRDVETDEPDGLRARGQGQRQQGGARQLHARGLALQPRRRFRRSMPATRISSSTCSRRLSACADGPGTTGTATGRGFATLRNRRRSKQCDAARVAAGAQSCRNGDSALMSRYAQVLEEFRAACEFNRGGRAFRPTLACLKAALVEMGVCRSEALAPGTPAFSRRRAARVRAPFQEPAPARGGHAGARMAQRG